MLNYNQVWSQVLDSLEREVTAVSFDLWLKNLEPVDIKNKVLFLVAPSEVAKNQCLKNHYNQIKFAIFDAMKDDVESFEIMSKTEYENYLSKQKTNIETQRVEISTPLCSFNTKYTFDNFVVGKSNQFVYAACQSVAENPCTKFNPLFIYSGVGLGKTHLLHAIGNYLKNNFPNLKVFYTTCEKFTNDYIDSLRPINKDRSIGDFRAKYRNLDVLMIDDIQFITNKMETQEEFFHTFNELYQSNKQIIIASDRPPKDIATLSDRLKSRFASGLIQDIQSPDFETRVAILKKKAEQEHYNIENEVITYLAEHINTNVREMEGMLSKIMFYANLNGKHFANIDDAHNAMKEEIIQEKSSLNADRIIDCVCSYYGVERSELLGKKKNKEIVDPRQVCIYIITEMLDLPLVAIGEIFGGRDHTTIMHSRDKIGQELKKNARLKVVISDIKNMIVNN